MSEGRGKGPWETWGDGIAVKISEEEVREGYQSVRLQPLPASLSPAISPIPGAFQDSGKAAGLGESHVGGRKDRRGSVGVGRGSERAGNWGKER